MKPVRRKREKASLRPRDAHPEAKVAGRSAIGRSASAAHLRWPAAQGIEAAYEQAYGKGDALDQEFGHWDAEGVWPEK